MDIELFKYIEITKCCQIIGKYGQNFYCIFMGKS